MSGNLFDQIHDDIDNSNTFDAPMLRYYGGPIPVFLWDNLQDYPALIDAVKICSGSSHYQYMHGVAYTKELMLPWYNMTMDLEEHIGLCLAQSEDINALNLSSLESGDLMPLQGKVVGLSLRAIRELDIYYENEVKYSRIPIDIVPVGPLNKDRKKTIRAFAYLNVIEDVADYSDTKKEWELKSDIDLMPFKDSGGVYIC